MWLRQWGRGALRGFFEPLQLAVNWQLIFLSPVFIPCQRRLLPFRPSENHVMIPPPLLPGDKQ